MQLSPPHYPIIYVRGYAGNDREIEDTVATPYMGFNLGSTKMRQTWEGNAVRQYFESPLIRLMKEHGYRDVYSGGEEMPHDLELAPRSIFIYRYYDGASTELGTGKREEIEDYAGGLSELVLRIRDRMCASAAERRAFRVCLVAHSMGGLVCRCFLQNGDCGADEARACVDKVFTYATPHNGIDMNIVGNVPGFFSRNNADNFNRDRMRSYLALPPREENVASLNGRFDPNRFFCLVGTNDRDYDVASGWARRMVGPMSDGLVRIANATVHGSWPATDSTAVRQRRIQSPRAYVYRSHSGHYGIVNSEDGYQNLTRFLFGNVRVDGVLRINRLTLPPKIETAQEAGKRIRASYHFEVIVRVRGAQWDLHRRTVQEQSAVFRTFDEMFGAASDEARYPHLFSAYLDSGARVNKRRNTLGFSVDLGVQVPLYEIDHRLWFDDYYDGSYLFRDKINLEAVPPSGEGTAWRIKYGFNSRTPDRTTTYVDGEPEADGLVFRIPVSQNTRPGLDGELVLSARQWNMT